MLCTDLFLANFIVTCYLRAIPADGNRYSLDIVKVEEEPVMSEFKNRLIIALDVDTTAQA